MGEDGTYSIVGDDIYHFLLFSKEYENQTHTIEFFILSGETYCSEVKLSNGNEFKIENKGLLKLDGSRGDYIVRILLQ